MLEGEPPRGLLAQPLEAVQCRVDGARFTIEDAPDAHGQGREVPLGDAEASGQFAV